MSGKRPDQYRIDPSEAGATDYKNLPQTGRGHSNLDDTVELDRQKHAESQQEASGPRPPGKKPAPSRDANRALNPAESERQADGERDEADSEPDRGDS